MKTFTPLRYFLVMLALAFFALPEVQAQADDKRNSTRKSKTTSDEKRPWKEVTILLDRPEKPYEVIGLVSAPEIFLWDDEESMKESLQKQAWKMKADAVILDRVETSFRFTGPAGGANGRAIRYK
jgi:hypothetical protein